MIGPLTPQIPPPPNVKTQKSENTRAASGHANSARRNRHVIMFFFSDGVLLFSRKVLCWYQMVEILTVESSQGQSTST